MPSMTLPALAAPPFSVPVVFEDVDELTLQREEGEPPGSHVLRRGAWNGFLRELLAKPVPVSKVTQDGLRRALAR